MLGKAWRPTRSSPYRAMQWVAASPAGSISPSEAVRLPRVGRGPHGSLFQSFPSFLKLLQVLRLSLPSGCPRRVQVRRTEDWQVGQSEARLQCWGTGDGGECKMSRANLTNLMVGRGQSMSLRRRVLGRKAQRAASEVRKRRLPMRKLQSSRRFEDNNPRLPIAKEVRVGGVGRVRRGARYGIPS